MGKSSKKAKSDRINALRKQYDAFLEEDKKRKERNDFILGRLDKMRYTTALVPVRHKPSTLEPRTAIVDHQGYQPQFPSVRDFQQSVTNQSQVYPDVPVKNNEDTYLIQEISKKYILIPKLRTPYMNNYMRNVQTINQNTERLQEMNPDQDTFPIKDLKPNTKENTDWKSKYEILNILKNEEKQSGNYHNSLADVSKHSVRKDSVLGNTQDQLAIDYNNHENTDVHVKTAKEYVDEFPEKELATDTLHYELPKDSKYILNNTECANLIANTKTIKENDNVLVANDDQTGAIGYKLQNITLEEKHSDTPNINKSVEVINYAPQPESDVIYSKQSVDMTDGEYVHNGKENPVEDGGSQNVSVDQHKSAEPEQVVYVDDNEISPIQIINSETLVKEMNSPLIPDVKNCIFEDGNSTKVSNVQEFASNNDIQIKTDGIHMPEAQTEIKSNIYTMEQAEPVTEQTGNPVNISESIEDFDTEQREMFYSDQPTDENYATQESDVGPFNLEYSQNEYSQNQDYAYYENIETEAYPVELNDEEVTQQYDPNYEQQYAGLDQGLEQQQYVQQYQEPENGKNQVDPEFGMLQYEQQFQSQGNIEKALDVEDGYIPQQLEAQAVVMQPNLEAPEIETLDIEKVPASE